MASTRPLKMAEEKFEEERFMKMLVNLKDTQESIQGYIRLSLLILYCFNETAVRLPYRQCCGSVTFWYGSGPLTNGSGSSYFCQLSSRRQLKNYKIFCLFLFECTVHFQRKCLTEVSKQQESRFFLLFCFRYDMI